MCPTSSQKVFSSGQWGQLDTKSRAVQPDQTSARCKTKTIGYPYSGKAGCTAVLHLREPHPLVCRSLQRGQGRHALAGSLPVWALNLCPPHNMLIGEKGIN